MTSSVFLPPFRAALVVAVLSGVYVALVSFNIPMFADDLCRAHHDFDVPRAVTAAWSEYVRWSGRFPVMFLNNLFFSGEGASLVVQAVLNGIVFAVFPIFLVSRLGSDRVQTNVIWVIWFLCLLWFSTRSFGEAVFWKTGAVQYFWGAFLACLFLVPVVYSAVLGRDRSAGRVEASLFVFACFVGGMWLENVSAAVAVVGFCLIVSSRLVHGRFPPRHLVLGFVAWSIGTFALIAAPGNYERIEAVARSEPLLTRLLGITSYLLLHMDPIILLTVILFLVIALWDKPGDMPARLVAALTFFITGILAAYATVGAPVMVFSGRVAFPSQVFFVVGAMMLFPVSVFEAGTMRARRVASRVVTLVAVLASITLAIDARTIFFAYESLARQESARGEAIREALANGQEKVQLPPLYFSKRLHTKGREVNRGRRFARDITIDSGHFINRCYARYYKLKAVAL